MCRHHAFLILSHLMILGLNYTRKEEKKKKKGRKEKAMGKRKRKTESSFWFYFTTSSLVIRSSTYPEFIDQLVSHSVQCLLKVSCPTVKLFFIDL